MSGLDGDRTERWRYVRPIDTAHVIGHDAFPPKHTVHAGGMDEIGPSVDGTAPLPMHASDR